MGLGGPYGVRRGFVRHGKRVTPRISQLKRMPVAIARDATPKCSEPGCWLGWVSPHAGGSITPSCNHSTGPEGISAPNHFGGEGAPFLRSSFGRISIL